MMHRDTRKHIIAHRLDGSCVGLRTFTNKAKQGRVRSDPLNIPCERACDDWRLWAAWLPLGGWVETEWRTERQVWRENATLKSREGSRDPGIGEESRDEVGPNEMANALPGMVFAHGEHGTG